MLWCWLAAAACRPEGKRKKLSAWLWAEQRGAGRGRAQAEGVGPQGGRVSLRQQHLQEAAGPFQGTAKACWGVWLGKWRRGGRRGSGGLAPGVPPALRCGVVACRLDAPARGRAPALKVKLAGTNSVQC